MLNVRETLRVELKEAAFEHTHCNSNGLFGEVLVGQKAKQGHFLFWKCCSVHVLAM